MMGPTHARLGGITWLGVAAVSEWKYGVRLDPFAIPAGALLAARFAEGNFSPDLDQDDWFGLPHRGPTHTVALIVPAAAGLGYVGWAFGPVAWVLMTAVIAGWLSHLVGDFFFGGIPILPGGRRVGLRFDTDGRFEHKVVRRLFTLAVVALTIAAVYPCFAHH
jgi:hypothetical protein